MAARRGPRIEWAMQEVSVDPSQLSIEIAPVHQQQTRPPLDEQQQQPKGGHSTVKSSMRSSLRSVNSMATPRMGSVLPDARKLHVGVLTVHIKRAHNLVPMDRNGLSDPFVVLKVNARRKRYRTSIQHETLNPVWDQFFEFRGSVGEFLENDLHLKVYDWDRLSMNDFLGEAKLPLQGLLDSSKLRFQLEPLLGVKHGTIDVAVRFEQSAINFAFPSPVADSAAAAIDARTPDDARFWEAARDWTLRFEREKVFQYLTVSWVVCVVGAIGCLLTLFPMQLGLVPWTAFDTEEATTHLYWAIVNGVVCALFTWQVRSPLISSRSRGRYGLPCSHPDLTPALP